MSIAALTYTRLVGSSYYLQWIVGTYSVLITNQSTKGLGLCKANT